MTFVKKQTGRELQKKSVRKSESFSFYETRPKQSKRANQQLGQQKNNSIILAPQVFVVGSTTGPHVTEVIKSLRKQKVNFVAIDWTELFQSSILFSTDTQLLLKTRRYLIQFSKTQTIYFTPVPVLEQYAEAPAKFSLEEAVYLNRWREFFYSLPAFIPKAKWWPAEPAHLHQEQRKWQDLCVAKKMGLQVPASILTNEPRFCRAVVSQEKFLLKEFGQRVFLQKGRKKILPHFEVKSENRNFDSIALTPIVLQKKLEKKCDLRVVMTAKRVFAFSITNKRGQAVEDWRVSSMEKLKIKKINIPNGVQLKLKKLLKARDLQMGCADFVLTDKNEWQFLELNRPGAWLFLQKLSRVSIADFLVKEMCR